MLIFTEDEIQKVRETLLKEVEVESKFDPRVRYADKVTDLMRAQQKFITQAKTAKRQGKPRIQALQSELDPENMPNMRKVVAFEGLLLAWSLAMRAMLDGTKEQVPVALIAREDGSVVSWTADLTKLV